MKAIFEIEMPKSCTNCPLRFTQSRVGDDALLGCRLTDNTFWEHMTKGRDSSCPLKPLPEPQLVTDCNQMQKQVIDLRNEVIKMVAKNTRLFDDLYTLSNKHDELTAKNGRLSEENKTLKEEIVGLKLNIEVRKHELDLAIRGRNWLIRQLALKNLSPLRDTSDEALPPDGIESLITWAEAARKAAQHESDA